MFVDFAVRDDFSRANIQAKVGGDDHYLKTARGPALQSILRISRHTLNEVDMTETDSPSTAETQSSDIEKGVVNGGDPPITTEENNGNSKKGSVRTGDKSNEAMVIPKNRIVIVFIGLMLTVFLAALDQTIVCTYPK